MSVALPSQAGNKEVTNSLSASTSAWPGRLEAAGRHSLRYGLVLVLLWIGGMKFTAYEAKGISAFVLNSPLMSWVYGVLSQRQFSAALGLVELVIAFLVAVRPISPSCQLLEVCWQQ